MYTNIHCSVFLPVPQHVSCRSVIMEARVKKPFTPVTSSASVRQGLQEHSVKSVSFGLVAKYIFTINYAVCRCV